MDAKRRQTIVTIVFALFGLCPAMSLTGLFFDIGLTLPVAIVIATIGGAICGLVMCPRPWLAGLVGGVLAIPVGLVVVYFYAQHRHSIWNIEFAFVQLMGCLPGFLIGKYLKDKLPGSPPPSAKSDALSGK